MSEIDLEAIRARDRDYDDIFEEQSRMSPDIAHRLVAWPVADRRALLAAYDALAARLAEADALLRDCYSPVRRIAAHGQQGAASRLVVMSGVVGGGVGEADSG